MPGSDEQSKNIFVSNLNVLEKCLLRWFPSASKCEKMAFKEIITLDHNVSFFWRNISFVPHNFMKYR